MVINLNKLRSSNLKYNNDISDVITTDKIKYIKNNIKMNSDKSRFTSPFGLFRPECLKDFMKNILNFKTKQNNIEKIKK